MPRSLALDDFAIALASMQGYEKKGSNQEIRNQMKRFVAVALQNELTEKQRYYLNGYYIQGKTMKHLAQENGVSESNVSKIIKRAINTLKARSVYLNLS